MEIFLFVECKMSRRSYEIFVLLFDGLTDSYRNFGANIRNSMGVRTLFYSFRTHLVPDKLIVILIYQRNYAQ